MYGFERGTLLRFLCVLGDRVLWRDRAKRDRFPPTSMYSTLVHRTMVDVALTCWCRTVEKMPIVV